MVVGAKPIPERRSAGFGVYFVVAGAVTLFGGIGSFFLMPANEPEVASEGDPSDPDGLRDEVRRLTHEMRLLRARQASTEESVRFRRDGEGELPDEVVIGPEPVVEDEDDAHPIAETKEEAEAATAARYEFLDASFESEPRDAAWSTSTEKEIVGAFQSDALSVARLRSATCGSTMCKVELSVDEGSEFGQVQEELARAVSKSLPRGTLRQLESGNGETNMVAYLVRPDSRLPHWEPGE